MSFTVSFWTFAKEVNSTAVPSGTGTDFSCVANDGVDIINPVISLQRGMGGTNTSPVAYNYCKIADFGNRYYFVENWEWANGLWSAHCTVDVLATYKTGISNMKAYVLRCAHTYDGAISDGMYPAKNQWSYERETKTNPWTWDLESGTYCVGIVGSGSTQYYLFNYSGFTTFLRYILSNAYVADVVESNLALNAYPEAKAIVDPLQYIASVQFIPITASGLTDSITIPVGFADVQTTGKHCVGAYVIDNNAGNLSWTIPAHPQAATRGSYLNHAPFTRRVLDFKPFGMIELDVSYLPAGATLSTDLTVDYPTGSAVLYVMAGNQMITCLKGKLGVDIQLGQVVAKGNGLLSMVNKGANLVSQIMGGITGGSGTGQAAMNATGAGGSFAGMAVGGIASAVSGLSSWAMDAINNRIPTTHSTGSLGSFADIVGMPCLYSEYATIVDESNNTRGRPLCKEVTLSTLAASGTKSGYIVVADPDVTGIAATGMERDRIAAFLVGGFYLA